MTNATQGKSLSLKIVTTLKKPVVAHNLKPRISGLVPSMLLSDVMYIHRSEVRHFNAVGFDGDFLEAVFLEISSSFDDLKPLDRSVKNSGLNISLMPKFNQFQHLCDIQSGEYFNILAKYALRLFVKKGIVASQDIKCYCLFPTQKIPPEYMSSCKSFYLNDKQGNLFKLGLEEVEAYAVIVANGGSF